MHLEFSSVELDLFAVATSIGQVTLFRITLSEHVEFKPIRVLPICCNTTLILHLNWSQGLSGQSDLALALSDGCIAVVAIGAETHRIRFVRAHSLETWYVAWQRHFPKTLFSGGDDSCLCVTEDGFQDKENPVHADEDEGNHSYPLTIDKRTHTAGVTVVFSLGHHEDESVILTGSYDEHMRVLKQSPKKASWDTVLEVALGGGVWRISPLLRHIQHPEAIERGWESSFVVSCMHAGPKIVSVAYSGEAWSAKVIAQFSEHESMNYASEATTFQATRSVSIVSTSFYDKKVCLWHL